MEKREQMPGHTVARNPFLWRDGFTRPILPLLFSCLLALSARPALSDQYIDLDMSFDTGTYASSQRVNNLQLGATYGVLHDEYDMSVFIPYLKFDGPITNESGIGDVILRGGRKLSEDRHGNRLYASAAIKVPTADENKGLGTGETDLGVFINYRRQMNQSRITFSGGYIATGDSSTINYNNVFSYGITLSTILGNKSVYLGLDGHQQTQPTGDNPLELTAGMYYQIQSKQFIHLEGMFGLSDGSPDYGIGVGMTHWFD